MFLSNPARYLVVLALVAAGVSACGDRQSSTGHAVRTLESEPGVAPFSTKEPETFQAEIVISSGGTERHIFIAKKQSRRRTDYDYGGREQTTLLSSDRDIVYSPRLSLYAETAPDMPSQQPSELENDVTANLLSSRPDTTYERLGSENGLSKFRSRSGDAGEVINFVDDAIGFPVRQEFYSVGADGQKILQYTMDVRDIKREVNDELFAVPANARKLSLADFRKLTRQN